MRNCAIWSVVFLAIAGTARGETGSLPKTLAVDLGGGGKLEMVLIPAGEFMMGDNKGPNIEKPAHKVRITQPFYLGKYEVTQQQWEAVMGSNPSKFKGPKNPVDTVSWDDCQAFLDKLNAQTNGQQGKFVLPTEAQWEYACRAGTTTNYVSGEDESELGEYAWYNVNAENTTHSVGEKQPNAFRLYDMHGNVQEWCRDWFDSSYYAKSSADDPTGPETGSRRVYRGGSWYYYSRTSRSAGRTAVAPKSKISDVGLRVALTPAS